MSSSRITTLSLVFAAMTFTVACDTGRSADTDDAEEEAPDRKREKKGAKNEDGDTVPAAAPMPKEPPSPADLDEMTWTEDGAARSLVSIDLSKRCLLKGMTMVLPEGASIKPLMGARGCIMRAWGGDDGPFMLVVNDALPVTMNPRDEVEGLTKVVEETENSWIAELDNPKVKLLGRYTRKFGKRTYYCVPNAHGVADLEVMRGMMKLCHTLTDEKEDAKAQEAEAETSPIEKGDRPAPKPFDKKKHAQQQNAKLKGMFGN